MNYNELARVVTRLLPAHLIERQAAKLGLFSASSWPPSPRPTSRWASGIASSSA